MNQNEISKEVFGEVISSYSRKQAIEDGMLVDVSKTPEAKEAGLLYPVAMTRTVWDRYVEVPAGVGGQDLTGRLWDILYMYSLAVKWNKPSGSEMFYELLVRNDNRPGTPPKVKLKVLCGPGDDMEPVVTIMLPEED